MSTMTDTEEQTESNPEEAVLEMLIQAVGNNGKFQKRFHILFNLVLVIFATMPCVNLLIALWEPDHWCYVPGQEDTNFTLKEWKDMHIPLEPDLSGQISHSRCKMYNSSSPNKEIINCQHGWNYDTTWYDLTAPMQEGWICDNSIYVTNLLVVTRIGEVVGIFFFGQFADRIGRRPIFFITILTLVFGRIMSAFTSHWLTAFYLVAIIGNLPSNLVLQGPLVIAMEITKKEKRAYVAMTQCVSWTFGMCLMPLIMWWIRDWRYFLIITTSPSALFILAKRYMIESPRWLANKGKISKCIKQLKQIAKINKTEVPENASQLLAKNMTQKELVYGVLALFSSWRMAKNAFLLSFSAAIIFLLYFFMIINVYNLGGNPYMNFFWQSASELPAYVLGKWSTDKFGRRWPSIFSFISISISCIPMMYFIQDSNNVLAISILSVIIKFSISLGYFIINLQALETYPTCIRQTGLAVGIILGSIISVLAPYMVYIGTTQNASYPYIICCLVSLFGATSGILLPETLNQVLPETLADAAVFGADQDFWGRKKVVDDVPEEKPLQTSQVVTDH